MTFRDKLIQVTDLFTNDDLEIIWEEMFTNIKNIVKEVLDVSKGQVPIGKESWW